MSLKHSASTPTPNISDIAGQYPDLAKLINELIEIIHTTNRNVYDDLNKLQNLEHFTSTTLPAAGDEWRGKMCVYTSGTDPDIVKVCTITGTSPDVYGWKTLSLS